MKRPKYPLDAIHPGVEISNAHRWVCGGIYRVERWRRGQWLVVRERHGHFSWSNHTKIITVRELRRVANHDFDLKYPGTRDDILCIKRKGPSIYAPYLNSISPGEPAAYAQRQALMVMRELGIDHA